MSSDPSMGYSTTAEAEAAVALARADREKISGCVDQLMATLSHTRSGPLQMIAAVGLIEFGSVRAVAMLQEVHDKLPPEAQTLLRGGSLLLQNDRETFLGELQTNQTFRRYSPRSLFYARKFPGWTPELFTVWQADLQSHASRWGTSYYRAYLGDVSEAAFRAVQYGIAADQLLGSQIPFFADTLSAELGGTTDFLAARGMAWLLGLLARKDEGAMAAIERARLRFRNEAFQKDCARITSTTLAWPPLVYDAAAR